MDKVVHCDTRWPGAKSMAIDANENMDDNRPRALAQEPAFGDFRHAQSTAKLVVTNNSRNGQERSALSEDCKPSRHVHPLKIDALVEHSNSDLLWFVGRFRTQIMLVFSLLSLVAEDDFDSDHANSEPAWGTSEWQKLAGQMDQIICALRELESVDGKARALERELDIERLAHQEEIVQLHAKIAELTGALEAAKNNPSTATWLVDDGVSTSESVASAFEDESLENEILMLRRCVEKRRQIFWQGDDNLDDVMHQTQQRIMAARSTQCLVHAKTCSEQCVNAAVHDNFLTQSALAAAGVQENMAEDGISLYSDESSASSNSSRSAKHMVALLQSQLDDMRNFWRKEMRAHRELQCKMEELMSQDEISTQRSADSTEEGSLMESQLVSRLEAELRENRGDIAKLQETIVVLKLQAQTAEQSLVELEKDMGTLRQSLHASSDEVASLKAKLAALTIRMRAAEEQNVSGELDTEHSDCSSCRIASVLENQGFEKALLDLGSKIGRPQQLLDRSSRLLTEVEQLMQSGGTSVPGHLLECSARLRTEICTIVQKYDEVLGCIASDMEEVNEAAALESSSHHSWNSDAASNSSQAAKCMVSLLQRQFQDMRDAWRNELHRNELLRYKLEQLLIQNEHTALDVPTSTECASPRAEAARKDDEQTELLADRDEVSRLHATVAALTIRVRAAEGHGDNVGTSGDDETGSSCSVESVLQNKAFEDALLALDAKMNQPTQLLEEANQIFNEIDRLVQVGEKCVPEYLLARNAEIRAEIYAIVEMHDDVLRRLASAEANANTDDGLALETGSQHSWNSQESSGSSAAAKCMVGILRRHLEEMRDAWQLEVQRNQELHLRMEAKISELSALDNLCTSQGMEMQMMKAQGQELAAEIDAVKTELRESEQIFSATQDELEGRAEECRLLETQNSELCRELDQIENLYASACCESTDKAKRVEFLSSQLETLERQAEDRQNHLESNERFACELAKKDAELKQAQEAYRLVCQRYEHQQEKLRAAVERGEKYKSLYVDRHAKEGRTIAYFRAKLSEKEELYQKYPYTDQKLEAIRVAVQTT
ncbi:hypothetical protein FVE85_6407 [Porphyridium purpureum]|uniref:Uncharacterized protein n=1 Tax=Porphyridium purpureum TaxID=35688 RepID=A0A5J4Z6Y5_PORPP|nr:hypothetical protein FVE85_6407 [Porphyridium purpureum]|eukprot:POR1965..scf295_1